MKNTFVFARVGGLSPVKQQGYDPNMPTFHCPPARKGIYAFVWPYIEHFLLGGVAPGTQRNACAQDRFQQMLRDGFRQFTHEGEIWCHFEEIARKVHVPILASKGSWIKVHTNDLRKIYKKVFHMDMGTSSFYKGFPPKESIVKNPYKRGLGGCFDKDMLEVFIERPKCGKVTNKHKKSKWRI